MFDSSNFNAKTSVCYRFLHFSWQIIIVIFLVENFFFVSYVSVVAAADQQQPPKDSSTTHRRDEHQSLSPKYKYSYHVRNQAANGGQHGHHFYRNGERVEGKYYVKLNEGADQNVEYFTDQFGYHPKVAYSNNGDSGSSATKMVFGAINFGRSEQNRNITQSNVIGVVDPTSDVSSSTDPSIVYGTRIEHPIAYNPPNKNENSSTFSSEQSPAEIILPAGAPTYESPVMFTHPPLDEDAFIRPEFNEISNGYIGKIVSVLPGLFTPNKLIRPIIVSDNATRKMDFVNSTEAESGEHVLEYRDASIEEDESSGLKNGTELDVGSNEESRSDASEENSKKPSAESSVEVLIEPQMIEEQAVITTTLDIAKSLPLNVPFVPDIDNSIHEPTNGPTVPSPNAPIAPGIIPPVHFLSHPHTFDSRTILNMPYPGFPYIPVPIIQHQPNVIPLNFVNVPPNPSLEESNLTRTLLELSTRSKDTSHGFPHHPEFPGRKQVKYRSIGSAAPPSFQPPLYFRKPLSASSHATNVSPTNLIPYVKQMTSSPSFLQSHPYTQYLSRQRSGVADLPPVSPQSMSYNVRYFPKDNSKSGSVHHQKTVAPFKPSHPLWDSIYPPSHMYYVPYYVFDKIPPNERKARDSFPKNRRYLRRLYVEYGGFKPPLIPSTLLEVDDSNGNNNNKEKPEVPKEKVDNA